MTARELINQRFRRVMLLIYTGFSLFIGAIASHEVLGLRAWVWIPGLVGFGIAWLTTMGAYVVGFRCPGCRGKLTPLLMQRGGLRMDPRIRYCPYCALALDSDITATGPQPNSPLRPSTLRAAAERPNR